MRFPTTRCYTFNPYCKSASLFKSRRYHSNKPLYENDHSQDQTNEVKDSKIKDAKTEEKESLGTSKYVGHNKLGIHHEHRYHSHSHTHHPHHSNNGNYPVHSHTHDKKILWVPRVPGTDNIPNHEIQIEGLFAGYRPLFLGNSFFKSYRHNHPRLSNNFFHSITSLFDSKRKNGNLRIQDIIEDLKSELENSNLSQDDEHVSVKTHKDNNVRKPMIPWEASLSGIYYNDNSFKNVSNHTMSKLRPFKMFPNNIKRKNSNKIQRDMIVMNVHNPNIDDKTEMINIYNKNYNKSTHYLDRNKNSRQLRFEKEIRDNRKNLQVEYSKLIHRYKFLKHDSKQCRNNIESLSKYLGREFHKLHKMNFVLQLPEQKRFPLSCYINNSSASRRYFKRRLIKDIYILTEPFLKTLLNNTPSTESSATLQNRINLRIITTANNIVKTIPCVYFQNSESDCVIEKSAVPNFKRIHWLNYNKRHIIFKDRNFNKEYVLKIFQNFSLTRSNIRYMKYPVSLYCDKFEDVFATWSYFKTPSK